MRYFVTVCATNCLGNFTSEVAIVSPYHEVKLYPPSNVQLSPVSADMMCISLESPTSWNKNHIKYKYKMRQERTSSWSSSWQRATIYPLDKSFSFKVYPNKSFSKVCVRVTAYLYTLHEPMLSDYTTAVCSYTNMTAPSFGPPEFSYYSEQQDVNHPELCNVTFTWQPLGADAANGIITNYLLTLSSNDSSCSISDDQEHYIPVNQTTYTVYGLTSYCRYRAGLCAENKKGVSPPSLITVIGKPYPVSLSTPLLGTMILISVIGFCLFALRLFLFVKKKVLPNVPEPPHNHQLWNFKIDQPVQRTEHEIFDSLRELKRGISTNTQSSQDSESYYVEPNSTRALLVIDTTTKTKACSAVRNEHYFAMEESTRHAAAAKLDGNGAVLSDGQIPRTGSRCENNESSVYYVSIIQGNSGPDEEREPFSDCSLQDSQEREGISSSNSRTITAGYRRDDAVSGTGLQDLGEKCALVYLPMLPRDSNSLLLDTALGECDAYVKEQSLRTTKGDEKVAQDIKLDKGDGYVSEDILGMMGNHTEKASVVVESTRSDSSVQGKLFSGVKGHIPNGIQRRGGYIKVSRCDDPYLDEEFAKVTVPKVNGFTSSVQTCDPYIQIGADKQRTEPD